MVQVCQNLIANVKQICILFTCEATLSSILPSSGDTIGICGTHESV